MFTFDPFGNIKKSGTSSFLPTYSATTNRYTLSGVNVQYDGDGNLKTDNLNTYTWDPNFGNPASVNGIILIYDALGRMVEQQNGTAYTQILYSPAGKTALMNGQTLAKAFINLPGGGTAIYNSTGLAYYRHSDWLGSSRLTSTVARAAYSISAYAPYGEQYAVSGVSDPSFTGQNSDTVSTLYDFTFRENSPSQGRWVSPDPLGMGAVDPTNPQSWNRYAYVFNNPLANFDPNGLECITITDGNGNSVVGDDGQGNMCQMMTPGSNQPDAEVNAQPLDFQTQSPANNGPNPRLLNIAQQVQNCGQFSNVGNQLAQGVNSGRISVGNVPSNAVATTNGWFNATSVIAPDALDDPSTVIHEWIHQTQAAGNPFFLFLKGANQIQSLFTSDSQGFLDYSAQNVANKIVSVCGVK
ncbi:MAG: RHS repeat-associated core domain-containing protein [Acidobacteriia bacterium]|nr:RHS repeat-associated core domain-containing protein [Terriglobia bacterium]